MFKPFGHATVDFIFRATVEDSEAVSKRLREFHENARQLADVAPPTAEGTVEHAG